MSCIVYHVHCLKSHTKIHAHKYFVPDWGFQCHVLGSETGVSLYAGGEKLEYVCWSSGMLSDSSNRLALIISLLLSYPPPVQQPDPNQPKAEGAQMVAMRGEQLGVVTNWPPSLEAALQRWGTISPKAPCLTTMDTNGKPLYVLTYGKIILGSGNHRGSLREHFSFFIFLLFFV